MCVRHPADYRQRKTPSLLTHLDLTVTCREVCSKFLDNIYDVVLSISSVLFPQQHVAAHRKCSHTEVCSHRVRECGRLCRQTEATTECAPITSTTASILAPRLDAAAAAVSNDTVVWQKLSV